MEVAAGDEQGDQGKPDVPNACPLHLFAKL